MVSIFLRKVISNNGHTSLEMTSFDYLLQLIKETRTLFVLTNDDMDSKKGWNLLVVYTFFSLEIIDK